MIISHWQNLHQLILIISSKLAIIIIIIIIINNLLGFFLLMFYVIFAVLVMLLWIRNLSVSYDIISTVLWSDTIPMWNVWLLVGIQSHLFPFQHSHSIELPCQSDHTPKLFHFDNCEWLHEQIGLVIFSRYVIRLNNLILVLFSNVMVSNIYVFSSTFHCWIYH